MGLGRIIVQGGWGGRSGTCGLTGWLRSFTPAVGETPRRCGENRMGFLLCSLDQPRPIGKENVSKRQPCRNKAASSVVSFG